MRVFKYTGFSRFAKKEGITDAELINIISQLEDDQADANLGGDVYKVRLARAGKGKSGGHRVIVYFKNEFRTFFVYGFSKSDKDNIDESELKAFKVDAKDQFTLTDEQIRARLKKRTLIEVLYGGLR
ncbi:MAG: type II toxin-antitoxin system RelE/ParE family toxin [Treponema sp.]|nr:type II toxin-antitoxin system RelE/ParE family toxin [Treponema sp.]